MSVIAIRTAIVAAISSVADIGRVHAYERYASNMDQLKALYLSADHQQLRGWFVRRVATPETGRTGNATIETIGWQIRGFMALNDGAETELAFDDLIERLRDRFRTDDTLGGTVDMCSEPGSPDGPVGLQLIDSGPAMFAGVLCHLARCALTTTRYLGP